MTQQEFQEKYKWWEHLMYFSMFLLFLAVVVPAAFFLLVWVVKAVLWYVHILSYLPWPTLTSQ